MQKTAKILDVKTEKINYDQTLDKIQCFIDSRKPHHICTINPEYLVQAHKDPKLKKIINNSDLNLIDGSGLIFAGLIKGIKLDKVTGVDLIYKISALANKNQYKIFFLGGRNGVAKIAGEKLKKQFPNLIIAGSYEGNPDFNDLNNIENTKIISEIKKANPDILLVAYGCPKQDYFISEFKKELNIPVSIGVGGSFDFISGTIKRAPKFMRLLYLEWLYRLFKEPSRLKRIYNATVVFCYLVILDLFKK